MISILGKLAGVLDRDSRSLPRALLVSANLRYKRIERRDVGWLSGKEDVDTILGHTLKRNHVRVEIGKLASRDCFELAAADTGDCGTVGIELLFLDGLNSFAFKPLAPSREPGLHSFCANRMGSERENIYDGGSMKLGVSWRSG